VIGRLLACLLIAWAWPAQGHVTTTGFATLDVVDGGLAYRLTVVATELEDQAGRLIHAASRGDGAAAERVRGFLRDYATFSIDGERCRPGATSILGSSGSDYRVVLDMALSCPKTIGTLTIRDDWIEVTGSHFQTVMRVRVPGRSPIELVFLEGQRDATVDLDAPAGSSWLTFVVMGVEHILGGFDHLLFLLALLAMTRGLWPIVRIVTGFTLGHSVTLSLAVLGVVEVPGRIVEPLIAATIIWVAVENLLAPDGGRWRWAVGAVFGLVHGLGFASALTELGLPHDAMVRALIGFNIGVELGQLGFVALAMPILVWLAKPGRLARLPQGLSVVVASMGVVWLVQRVL